MGLCDFKLLDCTKRFIGLTGNVVEGDITGTVALGDIPLSENDKKLVKSLPMVDSLFDKS